MTTCGIQQVNIHIMPAEANTSSSPFPFCDAGADTCVPNFFHWGKKKIKSILG